MKNYDPAKTALPSIINTHMLDYSVGSVCPPGAIDCSIGASPYPLPPSVLSAFASIGDRDITQYPHGNEVVDGIIDYFSPVARLERENVALGAGSLAILCHVNRLFLTGGRTVAGPNPRFAAYVDDVRYLGAAHTPFTLDKAQGYRFDTPEFISFLGGIEPTFICIENPHNPTGQVIPLDEVEEIVKHAASRGLLVLVDEAYGDYMPIENSAAALLDRYDNVAVARSFSKGLGLAGLRIGYLLGPAALMKAVSKLFSPYEANSMGRTAARVILGEKGYSEDIRGKVRADKEKVLASISNIKASCTGDTVPICLLYSEDSSFDMFGHLLSHGIYTVNGRSFENVGACGVRIMVCGQADELSLRLKKADAAMPK